MQQTNENTQNTGYQMPQGATKFCKNCKKVIAGQAVICPFCGKKQSGGNGKWIALGIVVFIFFISVIGIIGGSGEGNEENEGNPTEITQGQDAEKEEVENTEESEEAKEEQEKQKEEAEKEEGDNSLSVGSTFEKKGLKITVNNADLDFKDYSDEYGFYTPADGMKYIMVSFTFENTGKSDAYVSIYDFDCYADNTSCEQAYLPDDSDFINTNLSPGRNITFQTYYSVPVGATEIELEYETSIWTGEKAVIKLNN